MALEKHRVKASDPIKGSFLEEETSKSKPKERVRLTGWRCRKK